MTLTPDSTATHLKRDWRAILSHGYGTTFLTMPIALLSAAGETIKSGEFKLPYLLLGIYGVLVAFILMTTSTRIEGDRLISGSSFRRRSVNLGDVRSFREVEDGVTALNLSVILVQTDEAEFALAASRGLGRERRGVWIQTLRAHHAAIG